VGVFNPNERRTKRRYLFLFNDVLLLTKKEGKRSYWLKVFIALRSTLRVEDVPDSASKHKVEFRIYAPTKTIILFTHTNEQKVRWLQQIRDCISQREDAESREFAAQYSGQYSSPAQSSPSPSPQPARETISISGNIGKIEIPGFTDSFGDIPDAADDSSEDNAAEPEMISSRPNTETEPRNNVVPMPPTPSSTPVADSFFDDFDSIANRSKQSAAAPAPAPTTSVPFDPFADPQPAQGPGFSNSQPLQPVFPTSQPLQPTPLSGASILQPVPANSAPIFDQTPMQPSAAPVQSKYDGFAALKNLDMQGSSSGMGYSQPQGNQMYSPMAGPQGNVYSPNVSIEEQMRRLSMQAPNFQGNF